LPRYHYIYLKLQAEQEFKRKKASVSYSRMGHFDKIAVVNFFKR